jgi:hypothetical protein
MTRDCALQNEANQIDRDRKLELLLEAARRANWDALHGPPHLRTGRFFVANDQDFASSRSGQRNGEEAGVSEQRHLTK